MAKKKKKLAKRPKKKAAKKKRGSAKSAKKKKAAAGKPSARNFLNQLVAKNATAKLTDRKIADKVVAAYPKLPSYGNPGLVKRARRELNSGSLRGFDKPSKSIPEFDKAKKPVRQIAKKVAKKKSAKKKKAKKARKR